jgi:hypothetical protein
MSKGLLKCTARGVLVLALCLLSWASLQAAPISPPSPGAVDPYQAPAVLAADPYTSVREFVFTVIPDRTFDGSQTPSSMDLSSLGVSQPGQSAASLLLIGAAMIWVAGVIRYSLKQ